MNKEVERHIILLLGMASRNSNPKDNLILNEKLLYMVFFLSTDENKNLRRKVYHFNKGIYIPDSPILRDCLKSPGWYKECWVMDETGIHLTQKGIEVFRKLLTWYKEVAQSFSKTVNDIVKVGLSDNQLEHYIQLKYPLWVTKYVDAIDQALKANPQASREQVLTVLRDRDFISDTIKRAILSNSFTLGGAKS